MSSTVFVLGAGASKDAGAPLMNDFLDRAKDLLYRRVLLPADAAHFENVFGGIGRLQAVHSKVALDLFNLESVFATFEMARTLKTFGNADGSTDAVDSLRVLISRTLEWSLRFDVGEDGLSAVGGYRKFGELVKFLILNHKPRETVSIITFNYDVALDLAPC